MISRDGNFIVVDGYRVKEIERFQILIFRLINDFRFNAFFRRGGADAVSADSQSQKPDNGVLNDDFPFVGLDAESRRDPIDNNRENVHNQYRGRDAFRHVASITEENGQDAEKERVDDLPVRRSRARDRFRRHEDGAEHQSAAKEIHERVCKIGRVTVKSADDIS